MWQYVLKGLIQNAPSIINAGAALYQSKTAAANKEAHPDEPKQGDTNQIASIIDRIKQLETNQIERNNIQKQTEEQMQLISNKINEASCSINAAIRLGAIALIISIVTLLFLVFR